MVYDLLIDDVGGQFKRRSASATQKIIKDCASMDANELRNKYEPVWARMEKLAGVEDA